jgi:hypothetical protein
MIHAGRLPELDAACRKFVRTVRCSRTIEAQAGPHTITAAGPTCRTASHEALNRIHRDPGAH